MSSRLRLLLLFSVAVAAGAGLFQLLSAPLLADLETGLATRLTTRVFPALALVALVGWIVAWRLSRSAATLTAAAARLSAGDFSDEIAVSSRELLGGVARSLEEASARLRSNFAALEAERNHLNATLESMSEGVLAVDENCRITGINPAFKSMFEVDLDPVGRHPLEVIRNVEISESLDRTLQQKKPHQTEVTVGDRILLARFAPFKRSETLEGVVVVLYDMTELRRLERGRKEFISNVSHELKTPLTSIQGYAETLIQENLPGQHHRFAERIFRNAKELSAMIDELLSLARLEGEDAPLAIGRVDLDEMFEQLRREFESRLDAAKLSFSCVNRAGGAVVRGARGLLERVFSNLIENALRYTESGGITITVERDGSDLRIRVADTGIGIPEEDLGRIFERFYRVDTDRSRQRGGRGIGLAIVKHIIRLHGGRVWAESRLGEGTAICCTLPGDPEGAAT